MEKNGDDAYVNYDNDLNFGDVQQKIHGANVIEEDIGKWFFVFGQPIMR
jgi:hypothetical protein